MFESHRDMFHSVHELLESSEYYVPIGDHSSLQKSWYNDQAAYIQMLSQDIPLKSQQKKQAYRVLDLMTDAHSLFLKEALNPVWQRMSLEQRQQIVERIKQLPQITQRSKEWYLHYGCVLTASEFGTLFGSARQRATLAESKAFPPSAEDICLRPLAIPTECLNPTGWGIRFEPVVKQILEYKDGSKIFEPGRITHPHHGKLAASPDGLIESSPHKHQIGRLVEIKCRWTRVVGLEIPLDNWIQMQIQMEVADSDECEYVEVDIVSSRPGQTEPVDLSGCTIKGILVVAERIQDGKTENAASEYKYIYGKIGDETPLEVPEGWSHVETVPWGLRKLHRKIVQRDRSWFQSTLPWQEAFWQDVEKLRRGEQLPLTPKVTKIKPCLIVDDLSTEEMQEIDICQKSHEDEGVVGSVSESHNAICTVAESIRNDE